MLERVIEHLVRSLVENSARVSITVKEHDVQYDIVIDVDPTDLGRVIGKEGQTIRAIRSIAELLVPAGYQVVVDVAQQ